MDVKRSLSPHSKNSRWFPENRLASSIDYNFRIQTAPPLSLQQYARSIATIPGIPPWQHPGLYQPPALHSYLSPEIRKSRPMPAVQPWIYSYRRKYSIPTYSLKNYKDKLPTAPEPIWRPISPYVSKRPTSLSPEKKPERIVHEPVWHSPGRPKYKPVRFFDPPALRWSLQDLRKTMPDLQTKTFRVPKKIDKK